jgi:hypothetical protein
MVILDHVGRLQILVIDRVVLTYQSERCLVMKVLSLPLHLLMCFSEQGNRLLATMTPLLAPTDAPLGHLQCPLGLAIPARRKDARAIGERGEGFNTQVYTRFLTGRRKWLDGDIRAREADVPAIRFFGDSDRLGRPLQRARPA